MRAPSFADALRSEWLKFRTTRATVVCAVATLVAGVGYGALFALSGAADYAAAAPADRAAFDPHGTVFRAVLLVQVVVAAMGALAVTGEYRSGMMPVSVTVVPRRGRLLAAKAVVVGAVGLGAGQITAYAMSLAGHAVLAARGAPSLGLADPGVLGAVTGTGLYLAVVAVLGVAVGTLLRATAGAVAALGVGMVLVPGMSGVYPEWLAGFVLWYWPTVAGSRITSVRPDPGFIAPLPGFLVLCGFVAVMTVAAVGVFRARDV